MYRNFHVFLLLFVHITKTSIADLFLVRPGDGEQFVYSPVGTNATLHCAVNNMFLSWIVDRISFGNSVREGILSSRKIFHTTHSMEALSNSKLTVYGDIDVNNNIRICCESFEELMQRESCTTLIIYDSPLPPENVSVQFTDVFGQINISWTATPVLGVDQNYTIYFDSERCDTGETQFNYYIYQQNTSDSMISCSAYITAVNGAGESDPSNNVTIPSLPDIGPVTASLSHQIWKSAGGDIMVNVSFNSALYCVEYPVSTYLLKLKSEEIDSEFEKSLGSNETEVTIGPGDGLKGNRKYQYTVTAINSVGNTTSDGSVFITSDVQSVTATVVGESTIDIQCLFIHGSDAVGCKVVLVSGHRSVNNETATLIRKNTYASAQLKLTQQVSCYYRALAYSINVNNITSKFFIEMKFGTNNMCTASSNSSPVAIIVSLILITLLVVVVIFAITFSVIILKRKNGNLRFNSGDVKIQSTNIMCDTTANSTNKTTKANTLKQNEVLPTHPDKISSQSSSEVPINVFPNASEQSFVTYTEIIPQVNVPLYAVPVKNKLKGISERNMETEKEESNSVHNDVHESFYYLLENDAASSEGREVVPPTQELSFPLETSSSLQSLPETNNILSTPSVTSTGRVGHNIEVNDLEADCNNGQAQTVPLYAVPDKVRSKNKSVLHQSTCDSTARDQSDEENIVVQEHFYHVLENNKATCNRRETPPDTSTSGLPLPLKSDTLPSDPPPVYQDITEMNTKM